MGIVDTTRSRKACNPRVGDANLPVGEGIERRGAYWADLVIADLTSNGDDNISHSKRGWSPSSDVAFNARVRMTWVNGELRYRGGILQPRSGGTALESQRA